MEGGPLDTVAGARVGTVSASPATVPPAPLTAGAVTRAVLQDTEALVPAGLRAAQTTMAAAVAARGTTPTGMIVVMTATVAAMSVTTTVMMDVATASITEVLLDTTGRTTAVTTVATIATVRVPVQRLNGAIANCCYQDQPAVTRVPRILEHSFEEIGPPATYSCLNQKTWQSSMGLLPLRTICVGFFFVCLKFTVPIWRDRTRFHGIWRLVSFAFLVVPVFSISLCYITSPCLFGYVHCIVYSSGAFLLKAYLLETFDGSSIFVQVRSLLVHFCVLDNIVGHGKLLIGTKVFLDWLIQPKPWKCKWQGFFFNRPDLFAVLNDNTEPHYRVLCYRFMFAMA